MSEQLDNPAWQAKINPLVRALFVTDSVTSRMLRLLLRRGEMTQAAFMNEYHRRCDRAHPSRSSFDNNFGRFLLHTRYGMADPVSRAMSSRLAPYGTYDPEHPLRVMRRWTIPGKGNQKMLVWTGPAREELLAKMSDDELQHVFETLEHELTSQRATDVDGETEWWLALIAADLARRGNRHNPARSKGTAMPGSRGYRPQRVVAMLEKDSRPQFDGRLIGSPNDVVQGLADFIGGRANEVFLVLFVDVRNQLVGFTELTQGSPVQVAVDMQGIFAAALAANAAAIITVHQHPTGNATPSTDDVRLWERLGDAGKLLGVPVLDNMVVTRTHYYSQAEGSVVGLPSLRRAADGGGA